MPSECPAQVDGTKWEEKTKGHAKGDEIEELSWKPKKQLAHFAKKGFCSEKIPGFLSEKPHFSGDRSLLAVVET